MNQHKGFAMDLRKYLLMMRFNPFKPSTKVWDIQGYEMVKWQRIVNNMEAFRNVR